MRFRLLIGLVLACGIAGAALGAPPDEVVAVVSAKSSVTALTASEVADIFLGKSSRFPDGTQATPIDQPEESAVRDRFYSRYTGKSPAQVKAIWSKLIFTGRGLPPVQAADAAQVKKMLAANPAAIGYIDSSHVDAGVRVVGRP
ncbi:MAG TPA: phosphate ABC transporter substrate-binding protein [Usitatibacter sp.]|jgi:ABC-type phosphate transport system substrate-binding protein|nr:phosphate ABC transporter substrate-binding protein [Usitatibacter sp.]